MATLSRRLIEAIFLGCLIGVTIGCLPVLKPHNPKAARSGDAAVPSSSLASDAPVVSSGVAEEDWKPLREWHEEEVPAPPKDIPGRVERWY